MHILKPTHEQLNDATTGYCSALYTACDSYGDATSEVVTLLLDWCASVNGNSDISALTPLHKASGDLRKGIKNSRC